MPYYNVTACVIDYYSLDNFLCHERIRVPTTVIMYNSVIYTFLFLIKVVMSYLN